MLKTTFLHFITGSSMWTLLFPSKAATSGHVGLLPFTSNWCMHHQQSTAATKVTWSNVKAVISAKMLWVAVVLECCLPPAIVHIIIDPLQPLMLMGAMEKLMRKLWRTTVSDILKTNVPIMWKFLLQWILKFCYYQVNEFIPLKCPKTINSFLAISWKLIIPLFVQNGWVMFLMCHLLN